LLREGRIYETTAHPKNHEQKDGDRPLPGQMLRYLGIIPAGRANARPQFKEESMLKPLEEILEYKHPGVVRRFQRENPEKAHRAETIFSDLMRFFWGTKRHALDRAASPKKETLQFFFIMDEDMREIDQMWHVFLLYTQDYADYCEKFFGEFLHHQPDLVPLFERQGFQFETNLERFLNYTYDLLGEETVRRWFAPTLPESEREEIEAHFPATTTK
jgi:hypothetical protein